ncbi:MAG: hypothetical protein RRY33_03290 [Alistipes sp.]
MWAEIIYWIGVVLCVWCVYDLFTTKHIAMLWKIVIAVILLCCSWIGLLVYFFIVRNMLK